MKYTSNKINILGVKMKKILFIALSMCIRLSMLSAQITEFPFSEDFSNNTLPMGWVNTNWQFGDGYAYNTVYNAMLITPQLQLPTTATHQVIFLTYKISASFSTLTGSEIRISVSTTGNNIANFTTIDSWSFNSTTFQTRSLNISQYDAQAIYIMFQGGGTDRTLFLDDVWVGVIDIQQNLITSFPWSETFCNAPNINWLNYGWSFRDGYTYNGRNSEILISPPIQLPNLSTSQIMSLTYDVGALLGNSYCYYQVLASTIGNNITDFFVIEDEFVSGTFKTRTLNLSQYGGQIIYIGFQKRSGNGPRALVALDNVLVDLVNIPSVITTFPWSENFNNILSASNWINNGWSIEFAKVSTSNNMQLLITPQLQIPIIQANQAMFFVYKVSADYGSITGGGTAHGQVLISSTGNNIDDFTVIDSGTVSAISQTQSLNLSQYEGQAIYIAFQRGSGTTNYNLHTVWVGTDNIQQPIITDFPWSEGFDGTPAIQYWTSERWGFTDSYAITSNRNSLLITPQFQIPITSIDQAMFLTYRTRCFRSGNSSTTLLNYQILISTTGNTPTDFIPIGSYIVTGNNYSNSNFQRCALNLLQYEGQSIYIAFKKTNGQEHEFLNIDDIWVGSGNIQPTLITSFPWGEDFNNILTSINWFNNGWLFDTSAYTSSNNQMLITPQLQLPTTPTNQAMFLVYDVNNSAGSSSNTVDYQILVSTTGINTVDFTAIDSISIAGGSEALTRSLSLSQYDGQSIYIAFQRTGGGNTSANLALDNVWVKNPTTIISIFPWSEDFTSITQSMGWINDEWSFSNGNVSTLSNNGILITPQLQLPLTFENQAMFLSYSVNSSYNSLNDTSFKVLVSTTGNNVEDFTIIESLLVAGGIVQPRSINLSQFEGQPIYIAFQKDSGSTLLYLDDIFVHAVNIKPSFITSFPWSEDFTGTPAATNWIHNNWWCANERALTNIDNSMLITPQLQLPTSLSDQAMFLTYKVSSPSYCDYQILISTTGTAHTGFSVKGSWVSNNTPLTRSLNLSQYEGQIINIAFQKTNGASTLILDDILIEVANIQSPLITTLPWSETFEGTPIATNWTHNNWGFTDGSALVFAYNNMLITPQLQLVETLTNQTLYLTYKYRGGYPSNNVGYQILISTTGINTQDFTVKENLVANYGSDTFRIRSLNLTEYNGQSVYIAFQKTTESSYPLYIDDVWIGLPEPITNIITLPGNNRVNLTWAPPPIIPLNTTLQGYKIYRDGEAITSTITNTYYQDNTVVNGNEYTYTIATIYSLVGESMSEPVVVVLDSILPPVNLTASVQDYNITLTWNMENNSIVRKTDISLMENLQSTDITTQKIRKEYVSFEDVDNSNTRSLLGYKVYRGSILLTPNPIYASTFTDENVIPGTYSYGVTAVYSNGESTQTLISNVVVDNMIPPVNLVAAVNYYSITLNWGMSNSNSASLSIVSGVDANVNTRKDSKFANITRPVKIDQYNTRSLQGYNVYRENVLLTASPINTLTFTENEVTVGNHNYTVTAVYSNGESMHSLPTNVVVYNIQPPTNVLIETPGTLTVALTWSPPSSITGLLNYLVYRRIGATGNFQEISGSLGDTYYTDSGLENMITYYYRVTAVFSTGESAPTNIVSAMPNAVFSPVNGLFFTVGFNNVVLSWSAPAIVPNSATLSGYKIMRGGTQLEGNQYPYFTTYADSTAHNGQAYTYAIIALYANPIGESAPNSESVQMKVYNAPLNLVATTVDSQVLLNWLAPATHTHLATHTGYKVYRDTILLPNGIITNNNTLSIIDYNVVNGIIYTYYVVATYIDGDSEPSNTQTVIPVTDIDEVIVPLYTRIDNNYPNPFNPETILRFTLAHEEQVRIEIFSINGQLVRSLVSGMYGVGVHRVVWNGHDDSGRKVSSGIYFCRMVAGEYVGVRKMLLLK